MHRQNSHIFCKNGEAESESKEESELEGEEGGTALVTG